MCKAEQLLIHLEEKKIKKRRQLKKIKIYNTI